MSRHLQGSRYTFLMAINKSPWVLTFSDSPNVVEDGCFHHQLSVSSFQVPPLPSVAFHFFLLPLTKYIWSILSSQHWGLGFSGTSKGNGREIKADPLKHTHKKGHVSNSASWRKYEYRYHRCYAGEGMLRAGGTICTEGMTGLASHSVPLLSAQSPHIPLHSKKKLRFLTTTVHIQNPPLFNKGRSRMGRAGTQQS